MNCVMNGVWLKEQKDHGGFLGGKISTTYWLYKDVHLSEGLEVNFNKVEQTAQRSEEGRIQTSSSALTEVPEFGLCQALCSCPTHTRHHQRAHSAQPTGKHPKF